MGSERRHRRDGQKKLEELGCRPLNKYCGMSVVVPLRQGNDVNSKSSVRFWALIANAPVIVS